MRRILVIGATGLIRTPVVRRLLAEGYQMRLLARLGEHGDPAPANELLGPATTTVEDWCRAQAAAPGVNRDAPR